LTTVLEKLKALDAQRAPAQTYFRQVRGLHRGSSVVPCGLVPGSVPLLDEVERGGINLFGVGSAEKVLTALDHVKFGIG
jgi:hypothetical protein